MTEFTKNIKLVYLVYNKNFYKFTIFKEDLCQEGLIALWKICKKKDDIKVKFSAYATKAIYLSMLKYLQRKEIKHKKNCILFSELKGGKHVNL